MSLLEENSGTSTKSKKCSPPQTRANTRSKRSPAKTTNIQLPATKEADSSEVFHQPKQPDLSTIDHWIKFIVWVAMMGWLLHYGMDQHDNSILFGVMILVSVNCGYGSAIETLLKFLEAKNIKLLHPPKS